MPNPFVKLEPRQERTIAQVAAANCLTKEQAVSALLAVGAKAFASDQSISFSFQQSAELQTVAHESILQSTANRNSAQVASPVTHSVQAIERKIR